MKLTISAATGGGIGRQLLEQAVAAGHDVTAELCSPTAGPRRSSGVSAPRLGKCATASVGGRGCSSSTLPRDSANGDLYDNPGEGGPEMNRT
jgi:hypothetical protein